MTSIMLMLVREVDTVYVFGARLGSLLRDEKLGKKKPLRPVFVS